MVVALCNFSVTVGAAPPFGATSSRQNSTQGLGSCRQLLGFYRRRFWGLAANACSDTILYYSGWPSALKLKYSNAASSSSSFIECRTTLVATIACAAACITTATSRAIWVTATSAASSEVANAQTCTCRLAIIAWCWKS